MTGLVSIIIPNWNTTELLDKCIKAIYSSDLKTSYEIIVVDNASEDGFSEWTKTHPEVRIIQNDFNLGFSISIIQGLLISKGKYACFLNSDTEPAKGWLDYLIEYLDSDPKCGLVAPSGENVCCRSQSPDVNKGENIEIKGETIPFMCVVIPKRRFVEDGLPVIHYGEDVEFCNRVRSKGYKTMIVGNAFVKHAGSQCWVLNKVGRNQKVQQDFARDIAKNWMGE